ncbi:MAG TPA: hypothetical protein VMO17_07425, partial [Terriglobia bacterium]|nr:hypothetical protein [Terriglobia bacterium]
MPAGPPSAYYLQDGIAGRTYFYAVTTQGGSGALSGCTWSGASSSGTGTALPPALGGFTWL